jgi:hypothetical protein
MMPFKPQERAIALSEGRSMYFTGRPCKSGHVCKRITSNGNCIECLALAEKVRRQKDPEAARKRNATSYQRHRDKNIEAAAKYRKDNPEKVAAGTRRWRENNMGKRCAMEKARQARKVQASPPWLTIEHKMDIYAVYAEAKNMRDKYGVAIHVDHIVPIKGRNVCGLHVPWNLQLVTQSYNSSKGNRFSDIPETITPSGHVLVHQSALPWNLTEKSNGY